MSGDKRRPLRRLHMRMSAWAMRLWDRTARPLIEDRRGGMAPFVAVAIIPLIAFVGIGTDAARGYIVKSRLSYALDAAGLAGAHVTSPNNVASDVSMYFKANFPAGYMSATVTGPTVTQDSSGQVLSVSASATIPTTFLRVIGVDTMNVAASTEVTRETDMLELMLSMDVSGSMNSPSGSGMTRIQAARAAATDLVNILFGNNTTSSLLQIGLVPWNSKVNVWTNGVAYNSSATTQVPISSGGSLLNPLTGTPLTYYWKANNSPVPLLSQPPSNWKGCVYARYIDDGDDTDDADITLGQVSLGGKDWYWWQPIGPEGEPVSGWGTCSSAINGSECTPCYSQGITSLQSDKSVILNAISALQNPTGNTNLVQGLFWAWEALIGEMPYQEAATPPSGIKLKRAIVLITDGEQMGGSGDAYKGVFGLGSAAQPWLNQRARDLATAIKAMGIEIYAIQFGDITAAQQALMQDIATQPNSPYYFYAPDSATLASVFHQVADNLSQLRISK